MTDPWADMREYAAGFHKEASIPVHQRDLTDLLADADALLAVVRAAVRDEGYEFDMAVAALPEYLKGNEDD